MASDIAGPSTYSSKNNARFIESFEEDEPLISMKMIMITMLYFLIVSITTILLPSLMT